ncbi:MAG: hypothetical protein K8I02_12385, partial [Candidatus Methylomirabilis sp.]|nr:hypothetical protein [Deltaproteobacteria bacterium]
TLRRLASHSSDATVARLAAENLEDLGKPPGARNGPFYFKVTSWMPSQALQDLARSPGRKAGVRLLARHPELYGLAEVALDRGDATFRSLLLALAKSTRDERLLEALEPFARGRAGTDAHRMMAARLLVEEGRLPSRLRLYAEGRPQELLLREFQVMPRSRYRHSAQVQRLIDDMQAAVHRGQGPLAERLAKEALALEPDAPDLRNNLALVASLQGRNQEAAALRDELARTHPEYPMPHVQRASDHLEHGRLEQALDALDRVMEAPWLSVNEFAALCLTYFDLEMMRADPEAAGAWLERLDRVTLHHPALPECRRRLAGARPLALR